MFVYRVENSNGLGPYQTDVIGGFMYANDMCMDHADERHPSPYRFGSGLEYISVHEYCAFDTMANLIEWFADYVDELDECLFDVSVYAVPVARTGEYGQTCFVKDDATLVTRIKISEVSALVARAAWHRDSEALTV